MGANNLDKIGAVSRKIKSNKIAKEVFPDKADKASNLASNPFEKCRLSSCFSLFLSILSFAFSQVNKDNLEFILDSMIRCSFVYDSYFCCFLKHSLPLPELPVPQVPSHSHLY